VLRSIKYYIIISIEVQRSMYKNMDNMALLASFSVIFSFVKFEVK
jgi:hypothetical protein